MEGTKNFGKFLEDISKGIPFYKAAALQPIYLLKRAITYILYKRPTPEAHLEPSPTSMMKLFCKKNPSAIFSKTFYPKCSTVF